MTIRIARRFALILAVLVAPWALSGCGDSSSVTPITTDAPPPAKTDAGKYVPPPTAAQPTKTVPAR